ncbi:SRPBCC family protein [Rhodococcus oryzae]|uniref:SRPBCC family protein n=1 Tax=Rhodococcus oryzae TaxID=2571143 RepID=A0ABY2RLB0_9NOCA|nr:SRPBCC family protein [Rhodococcus oryzae]TJZ77969.1 SRPBCC family protein [Rhodococcus oryzae]
MAYIRTETLVDTTPERAWDALRDWGALHERLAAGFVTNTTIDGGDRIVTFGDGSVVRERLVALDEAARRLSWSIVGGPYEHHNGSAQVFAESDGRTRFVWIADVLPDALADRTTAMMELGTSAIRRTLEGDRVRGG